MPLSWLRRLFCCFSLAGLVVGTVFFAVSLTPSLIPRTPVTQGVVSGFSLSVGYGIGVLALWLWSYLELPIPCIWARIGFRLAAVGACVATAGLVLWRTSAWQNTLRRLMALDPLDSAQPLRIGLFALLLFLALILLARLFRMLFHFIRSKLKPFIPKRISHGIALTSVVLLFWFIVDGLVFRVGLRIADSSYQRFDALKEPGIQKPADPLKTGSKASLIPWETLGRAGRGFVSSGASRDEIAGFLKTEALEPIRVYAGLNSAETSRARARLALEELKRVDAFSRSKLVIVTPTGTGLVDPAAMNPLEYLAGGDIASVAVQYSYLASWLSLLVEPAYGAEAARELFMAVYDYWTKLPPDRRPKLYLFGLSLGALNSDLSVDLFDIVADPFQGALWSGPPFSSKTWRYVTQDRAPDSPAWLPRFRDSSIIRFTNQEYALDIPGAEWGPIRIVYLQYASDPITFFDPRILYRRPEWMIEPRGPDVSPYFQWFPIVTMLQLLIDIMAANSTPMGYGHVFAPEHYIDAWVEIMDLEWPADQILRLKSLFAR